MTLKVDSIVGEDGTSPVTLTGQSAAKAILHYDQTANTVHNSENISSVTDTSSGLFTPNYTNNFTDQY